MRPVLQLNADYTPMKILGWEHAVELVLEGKASTVVPYEGAYVRSEKLAVAWPAVIALKRFKVVRGRVKFSARNVLSRDSYQCGYCGLRPRLSTGAPDRAALTLDHVVPRAHAKHGAVYLPWSKRWVNVTCWENAMTACGPCNARKADRTPAQANMVLRALPRTPTVSDVLRMSLSRVKVVPAEWYDYLPPGWRESMDEAGAASVARVQA